jgi:putative N6-adenine-specific DNA methylase
LSSLVVPLAGIVPFLKCACRAPRSYIQRIVHSEKILAITSPGLEGILARELKTLGLRIGKSIPGGVEFTGNRNDVMRANLWSRVANRIVVRVDEFHASSFHELERRAKKVEWGKFFASGDPVRFRVTCRKSRLYHSDAVAERLGQAAARVGATITDDEDEESGNGDGQLFIVRLMNDICTISADSSGDLLHRRGYRQAVAKAPLRETLAAAMLIGSGWDPKSPLVDPMCGSGTIAIEGAMMARSIAPGVDRKFAFERWPDHDGKRWKSMIDEARSGESPTTEAPIIASDRDAGAITASISNAKRARVLDDIEFKNCSLSDTELPIGHFVMVTNPPYGLRIGESGPLKNLYATLGRIIREAPAGCSLALLSADKALDAQLKLPLEEIFRTTNGGVPVRLIRSVLINA